MSVDSDNYCDTVEAEFQKISESQRHKKALKLTQVYFLFRTLTPPQNFMYSICQKCLLNEMNW